MSSGKLVFRQVGNFMQCELHFPDPQMVPAVLGLICIQAYELDERLRDRFYKCMQQTLTVIAEEATGKKIEWPEFFNNKRKDRS